MRVLLAGGGTAGHTSPLLATADALVRLDPTAEITCLGTPRGLESTVVPAAGYPLELIPPVPLPRRPNKDLARVPSRLRGAVKATHEVIDRVRPDVIVGYGGYVSMPAYLAARKRGLPLVIHEQNAKPGLANKVGARFADRVAVSFPDTPLKNAEYVGLPLRRMISQLDRPALRAEARAFFGLDPDLPTLVVTGGSLGAWKLNRAVSRASAALGAGGVQVLHVIGARGKEDPEWVEPDTTGTPSVPYVVLPFVDRMDYALAAADLMVCRAGASSVVEAAASGVPAIFVPLAHGNGEQVHNARPVVEAGGALMVGEETFTADYVADTVPVLAGDRARLAQMGAAAAGLVPSDADDRLAAIVAETAAR
jgi:UDP-N-acetylglucosamine--N-acetylmuramyl-(pentapeptide) pyrophosphoryl-undecaprenol N-acetylglucosamine transferase